MEPLKSEDVDFIWSTIKEELRRKVEAIPERISTELLDQGHLVDCEPTIGVCCRIDLKINLKLVSGTMNERIREGMKSRGW